MPAVEENGLKERLQNALDEEYRAGRISDRVFNRTADKRSDEHASSDRGDRSLPRGQKDAAEHGALGLRKVGPADDRQSESQRDERTLAPRDIPKADTPDGLKPYDVARVPIDF